VYTGEYSKGKRSGEGILRWPNGKEYIGSWKDGKQHGIGKVKEGGSIKTGQWKDGKFLGWIPS